MKRDVKNFALGFIMACLMITPVVAFADAIQVSLNTVNINLNGVQVTTKGQSYILTDGSAIPYSLNYNGTVYLPIRKVAELVGKDIGYDGQSTTISISDKKTETEVTPTPVDPKDTTETDAVADEDAIENPTDNSSNTSDTAKEETGFAVVNNFSKVLNSSGVQVNKAVGFLDSKQFNMLTSKKDLIDFTKKTPSLYEIKYRNNVITEMDIVSPDKEDMLKADAQADKLEGNKDTYNLSSIAVIYRIERDGDGNFDGYSLSKGSSLKAGDKIYLYDIGGKSGYDIVIEEDSWI